MSNSDLTHRTEVDAFLQSMKDQRGEQVKGALTAAGLYAGWTAYRRFVNPPKPKPARPAKPSKPAKTTGRHRKS